jgi:predicted SnoaL-like aldol condensation-catalyzing enzyme
MTDTTSFKDFAIAFLSMASSGQVEEAYRQFVGDGFRHHNPYFHSDADSLMRGMQENADQNPEKILEVQRAIQEDNLVAVHSRVRQDPSDRGGAVVHIFRFENGKIVELWDVGQAEPDESMNENGMF